MKPMTRRQHKVSLYKLALARSDFLASRNACEAMDEHVRGFSNPLYYHLFTSAVIAYAKPFVNCELGVLPSQWAKFDEPWMREIHRDALKARHEVIVHNDAKARKMWIVPPGVAPAGVTAVPSTGIVLKIETYYISGGFFKSLAQLCDFQIHRMNKAVDDQLHHLYDGESLPATEFQLILDDSL